MVKVAIYTAGGDTLASSRVRILMMYPFLARTGYDVKLFGGIETADVVIIQKRCDPCLFKYNAITILDIDDNYLEYGHQKSKFQNAASQAFAVVVSTSELAKFVKKYNENVFVIPTGVDCCDETWKQPNQKENISRVAWLGYPENIVYLLKLMPLLKKCKYTLCLITRNTYIVSQFIAQNKEIVEFHEWNLETVDDYLETCDLGLAPLDSDPYSQSKSAYKILKYWANGLPVICDLSPENKRIEEEFGIECIARNLEEWSDKLQWSKGKRNAQVLKAQGNLFRYGPKNTAAQWASVIDNLIMKHDKQPFYQI